MRCRSWYVSSYQARYEPGFLSLAGWLLIWATYFFLVFLCLVGEWVLGRKGERKTDP